jgi:hypothetical protein
MMTLIREGGWPMWFTLAFGLISLGAGARFAHLGQRRQLGFLIGMSLATLFSVLNGIAADLSAVGHSIGQGYPHDERNLVERVAAQGFAESMSPGILGFTLLSLTWMLAAVGLSRMQRREPPAR